MRAYIDVTGKTEEEAIQKALDELNLDRDEVSVEILERAKKGFLGIGSSDAKVRIRYGRELPDETPDQDQTRDQNQARNQEQNQKAAVSVKKTEKKPEKKPEREQNPEAEREQNRAADTVKSDQPEREAADGGDTPRARKTRNRKKSKTQNQNPAQAQNQTQNQTQNQNQDKNQDKNQDQNQDQTAVESQEAAPDAEKKQQESGKKNRRNQRIDDAPPVFSDEETDDEKARAIKKFLSGLFEHLDQEAEIHVYPGEGGRYKVILEGPETGMLIGRRGETLDAIQQLTNYAVNRTGSRARIQLDAEGYREKRERSLSNLARKEAAKVVKFRRARTLEPMNAYERHVIHAALQDYRGVNTYSTGVDPNRRVIIAYNRDKL